jgi:hypothetical protein
VCGAVLGWADVPAGLVGGAPAQINDLDQFLAMAEAAGIKSIHDLPGLIPALQATEPAQVQQAAAVPAGFELVALQSGTYGWRYAVAESAQLLRDIDRCGGLKNGGEQYPNALNVHDMAGRLDAVLAAPAQAQQAARDPVTAYTNRGIGASSTDNGHG